MDDGNQEKYPGGISAFIADVIIYIVSSLFILLCGLIRIVIEIIIIPLRVFKMMRRKTTIIVISLIILIMAVGYSYLSVMPAGDIKDGEKAQIIIKKGESLTSAAVKLKQKSIIDNTSILKGIVELLGSAGDVKAGQYDFSNTRSYISIAKLLLTGSNSPVKVTFPEGLTYRQMAGIAQARLEVDSLEFIAACEDSSILKSRGINAKNLEGYLFPDTYYFFYGTDPASIVNAMVSRFYEVFDDSMRIAAEKQGLTVHKAVTLASLIEKETGKLDEREIISAVFHNRLKRGMRLQCDPTVIYALPDLNRSLMLKDLEVNSPYNTYRYYGLPPGPIANPGRRSLYAAVHPEDVSYLYFVANAEGGHFFASNLRQHNNNVLQYKKILRSQP